MARAIWDQSFKTIGDQSESSKACLREKLIQVAALRAALTIEANPNVGPDTTEHLEECLVLCMNMSDPAQPTSAEKYDEIYNYAVNAAMGIDVLLSKYCCDLKY